MKNSVEDRKSVLFNKAVFFNSALFFLCFLFCFTSCSSIKDKVWTEEQIIEQGYETFAQQVREIASDKHFSGAVLVAKDNKIIFASGFGKADKKNAESGENTIHSVFETGSITKQMTAACIMQLAHKKQLSIDDKISKYFPDYVNGNDITVRMLLNMRSGLTDHINAADDFFPARVCRQIDRKQIACEPVEENLVLTHFYDAPLIAKPDSTYFYCNTNYYLLAKIIEQVSGMSYQEYLKKNIFEVCGMQNSNVMFQNTTSKGYDYRHRYYSIPAEISFGCGDVNSSVLDLYKWNTMFARGKVVRKKAVKQILDTESYGFGVYRRDNMIFHGGVTNVFNSYNSYFLDDKLSIIVLCNQPVSECNATVVAGKIYNAYSKKE